MPHHERARDYGKIIMHTPTLQESKPMDKPRGYGVLSQAAATTVHCSCSIESKVTFGMGNVQT